MGSLVIDHTFRIDQYLITKLLNHTIWLLLFMGHPVYSNDHVLCVCVSHRSAKVYRFNMSYFVERFLTADSVEWDMYTHPLTERAVKRGFHPTQRRQRKERKGRNAPDVIIG